jgi:hypothetical protein
MTKRLSDEERSALPARVDISNAYSFVKGSEAQDSLAALTFEEMLRKQVDRLEGKDGGRSASAKIDEVERNLKAVIEQAKRREREDTGDNNVNTP